MRLLALLGLPLTAACGLDVVGLALQGTEAGSAEGAGPPSGMEGGSVPDASASEARPVSTDAGAQHDAVVRDSATPEAGGAPADAGATCTGIPMGWSPAIYGLSANPCPARFASHDAFAPPTVGSGACSCSCNVTQPGSCTQGALTVTYGNAGNGSCPNLSFMATFNGPGCVMLGSQLMVTGSPNNLATPLPPQGGTCDDMVHADSSQLAAPSARYCDVPADSVSAVCGGTVPSGFAACIVSNGEMACPSGTSFVQRYVVGDRATLQCSTCSPCMMATTCSNAVVTGFTDSACTSRLGSAVVDGTCSPVTFYTTPPATLVAVQYAATASSICVAGTSSPTAQMANPRTLCCR